VDDETIVAARVEVEAEVGVEVEAEAGMKAEEGQIGVVAVVRVEAGVEVREDTIETGRVANDSETLEVDRGLYQQMMK
jgi:hypothetical protein